MPLSPIDPDVGSHASPRRQEEAAAGSVAPPARLQAQVPDVQLGPQLIMMSKNSQH